jgi:hypothetical protein
MKLTIALAAAAALTVTTSACKGGKGEADCKAAANAYATVLRASVQQDSKSEEKKAQALSIIPTLKDEMIKTCEREKWPAQQRACFATAKIKGDLERCMARAPAAEAEAEAEAEQPAAPEGGAARPDEDEAPAPEAAEPPAKPAGN